ncbi:MAG: Fe-S cluster assembly transcriptional regulator IscR, partial [Pseudomonadales bacterium]
LSQQIHQFLSSIDLASLIEKREIQEIAARQEARCDELIRLPAQELEA